jgi:hypothetical protein
MERECFIYHSCYSLYFLEILANYLNEKEEGLLKAEGEGILIVKA